MADPLDRTCFKVTLLQPCSDLAALVTVVLSDWGGFNLSVAPPRVFCWHHFWVCLGLPQSLLAVRDWGWTSAGICGCFVFTHSYSAL